MPVPPPPAGRGAASNPAGRFERLHVEADPEAFDAEAPARQVPTVLLRDDTRSVIVRNSSPDVGFAAGLNPYRGCEHGCAYCLSGDTPILMADGRLRPLADLRAGDAIYGTVRHGFYRRFVVTTVQAHWRTIKPAYRLVLEDGTEIVTSADHRFLTERGWKYVTGLRQGRGRRPHLTTANALMGIGAFVAPPPDSEAYRRGYLCGLIRGDGTFGHYRYPSRAPRGGATQHHFRLALCDAEALDRAAAFLVAFGLPARRRPFSNPAGIRPMEALFSSQGATVSGIEALVAWPEAPCEAWTRGFLAGFFDAEGSYGEGCLRLHNTDEEMVRRAAGALRQLGFTAVLEVRRVPSRRAMHVLRLTGGLVAHLRFFHTVDPAITRKRCLNGRVLKTSAALRVRAVEPLGLHVPMFDLTTGTGDFIANGVVAHNCYARPTHEYLGFSAGLDFETRIVVKDRAPALLAAELSRPGYRVVPLALSGNTDPYQPVERRLRLTRRILEVLARHRHPVSIITKNALVTRDVDVLAEMARLDLVHVYLSVTSLRDRIVNALEPRTSRPAARLKAIRALTEAGVPVGVAVAPVIPGLTDAEVPAILEAAADAGATGAFYGTLRLPGAVRALFFERLAASFPNEAERVRHRMAALHGPELRSTGFGARMRGQGPHADTIRFLFRTTCARLGLDRPAVPLSTAHFRRLTGGQMDLF